MKLLPCLLICCVLGLTACVTKPPKNMTTLRIHVPATEASSPQRRMQVAIRVPELTLQVDAQPVLTEADLDHAQVTGEGENLGLRLYFNTHGTIVLDTVSLNYRSQMLVIMINGAAIGAPLIKDRIVDGVFEFTPDLSREQAEKIVAGLNATAAYLAKVQKQL